MGFGIVLVTMGSQRIAILRGKFVLAIFPETGT